MSVPRSPAQDGLGVADGSVVPAPRPLLAAVLIVRDESANLPACLASLADLADEIVVYDTGSVDGTRELARAAGARVLRGYWDGSFARARNAALGMTRAQWALSVDADERLDADPNAVRSLLVGALPHDPPVTAVDGFLLRISHVDGSGREPVVQMSTRLFRPDRQRWVGRVHEVLSMTSGGSAPILLPPWMAQLRHFGYLDAETVRRRAERNLELAQAELDDLVAAKSQDRDAVGRVLLDLARSFLAVGRRQDSVNALETLRDVLPGGVRRACATALLAQILLEAGGFEEVALVLEADLRESGLADPRLADWLRAQALRGLGDTADALRLLRGIDRLQDPAGTPQAMGPVLQARAILAAAAGSWAEARAALLAAMTVHGNVHGNGPLLLELFAGEEDELVSRLRAQGGPNLPALAAELAGTNELGGRLSRRLGLLEVA
jgi:hypothetical protein